MKSEIEIKAVYVQCCMYAAIYDRAWAKTNVLENLGLASFYAGSAEAIRNILGIPVDIHQVNLDLGLEYTDVVPFEKDKLEERKAMVDTLVGRHMNDFHW
jgi:hypothetical protein